ncbi:MAG: hypothetical protein AAGJ40_04695 [Planctomycetota bacterium]
MNRSLLAMLLGITLTSGTLMAQKPLPVDPLDHNAALSYWQAFALLPPIDDATRERVASIMRGDSVVDDDMQRLVTASDDSLMFFHRGTSIESCAWGLAFEAGPYAYLPHLGKARELSRVALIRARLRFKAGQVHDGMDDTIAAIQLGRQVSQQGVIVLINLLVGLSIESETIETVVSSLQYLDQSQRDELERRINQFPREINMSAALQGERDVFLGWLIREVESGRSRERILGLASESTPPTTITRVQQASPKQILGWAKEMGLIYDAVIAAMSQPNETIEQAERLESKITEELASNPLAEMFLPAFGSARLAGKRFVTKRAQLAAAFALFQSGPSALDRQTLWDPYGDGPFELERVDEGVELISDLKRDGMPVRLRIPGLPK